MTLEGDESNCCGAGEWVCSPTCSAPEMDGPEETCSRHGRSPRDLWNLLDAARRTVQGEPTAHRFEGESEPIATNPILRGVDLALERLVRRDCFTERTMRIVDELRAEVLAATQEGENR